MKTSNDVVKPTILITGASGMSGFLAVKEFADNNHPVSVLIRDAAKASMFSSFKHVTVFTGDMAKPETTRQALNGIEKVFLISTANSEMLDVQCKFIDACNSARVRHVIKFSGAEPDFNADNFLFTRMHEQIEDYLEISGMIWTHLRPSQFMQVYLREMASIDKGKLFLPFGNIQLAPVDAADIAKIAFQVITSGSHQNQSIDVTGPEALTMYDVAAAFSAVLNKPVKYVPISVEERHNNFIKAGLPEYFVNELDKQTIERLKRPFSRVITGIFQELNITPVTFMDFLTRNKEHLLSENNR